MTATAFLHHLATVAHDLLVGIAVIGVVAVVVSSALLLRIAQLEGRRLRAKRCQRRAVLR